MLKKIWYQISRPFKWVWRHKNKGIVAYLVMALFVSFAFFNSEKNSRNDTAKVKKEAIERAVNLAAVTAVSNYKLCKGTNEVRTQILTYIGEQVARQKISTTATLASPTATDDQKKASLGNYVGLSYQYEQLKLHLVSDKCIKPTQEQIRIAS